MTVLRLSRLVLRIAGALALAIAILWAAAALWIDGPESRVLAGTLAGGLILIAGLLAVGRGRRLGALRDRAYVVADPSTQQRP